MHFAHTGGEFNLVFCTSSDDRKCRRVELVYNIYLKSQQSAILERITTMFLGPFDSLRSMLSTS